MDMFCHSSNCQTRLKNYQDQVNKLNSEIAGLEDDFKERDDFLQTVVKGRNDLKKEARVLKEKNVNITKENDELVSKIKQLKTKSEADLKKVMDELKDCKDKLKLIEEEFDIDYDMAASIRDTGEKLKKQVKETRIEVQNFEKKKLISDKLIRSLQQDNLQLKKNLSLETAANEKLQRGKDTTNKKIVDLEDKILAKNKEVQDINKKFEKMSTSVSKSSLKEELERVPFFSCNQCEKTFVTLEEFRTHMKKEHENKLLKKVELLKKTQSLQETISKQKGKLISSILKLKNKEFIKKPKCNCRGFCLIDHKRYNFQKCEADEIFKKIEQLSNDNEINNCSQHLPNSSLLLDCDDCEKTF